MFDQKSYSNVEAKMLLITKSKLFRNIRSYHTTNIYLKQTGYLNVLHDIRFGTNKNSDIDTIEYFISFDGEQMNMIERFFKVPLKYKLGFCYFRMVDLVFVCVVFIVCYNEFIKIDLCTSTKQTLKEIMIMSPYICFKSFYTGLFCSICWPIYVPYICYKKN
jgi:hypothetical protein